MTGRLSLSEQLAAIRDDAPLEYDPESAGFEGLSSSRDRNGKDLNAGRADYLHVGESKLRRNLGASELEGNRYAGVKSSRSQLFGQTDDIEDDEEEEESVEESADEELESLLDDQEDDENLPFGEVEDDDEDDDDDDDIPEEESEERGGETFKSNTVKAYSMRKGKINGNSSMSMEDDSRAMIQELKKASSAEVEKGRDVKRQLSFWDTLLEARIRLQKYVSSMNVMPEPNSVSEYTSASSDIFAKTTNSLEELSELLFSVRRNLLQKNDKLELPISGGKKRKRGSPSYLDSALDDLESMTEIISPYERNVISKWSDKVSAASGSGASSQQNRFKAIGTQNTLSQIDSIINQDMSRLIDRTRIRRTGGGKNGVMKVVGRDGALEPVEGEKDVSENIFDDTDFYQSLLREVVDSSSAASGLLNSSYGNLGINTVSRKKASIDPKASKGRKLRYHVHEKLQNFMAPIPTLTWEKEQTDELFRGLLGGIGRVDVQAEEREQDGEGMGMPQVQGQLRIF